MKTSDLSIAEHPPVAATRFLLNVFVCLVIGVTGCQSTLLQDSSANAPNPLPGYHGSLPEGEFFPVDPRAQSAIDVPMTLPATDGVARIAAPTPINRTPHDPLVSAISFSQAEPRQGVSEDGRVLSEPNASWINGTAWQQYPDEYLLTGGDRNHPVHYDSFFRYGVETEDSFAEYVDHLGESHVRESKTIAIYAPRFGTVRTTASPEGGFAVERLSGMKDTRYNSGVKTKVGPDTYAMADQVRGTRVRSRASGVENREWLVGTDTVVRLGSSTKLMNTFMDFAYTYRAELNQRDEARLASSIAAAQHWTRDENPVVVAQLDSVGEVYAKFRAAAMKVADPLDTEPGRLQIAKMADTKSAQPGDVVTFAIRYDNLGERELYNVQIVDNLTPRLELIEDSAASDRPGDLNMQDNKEGSLVLTFTLDDPLPAKTGGVITFQCRVR